MCSPARFVLGQMEALFAWMKQETFRKNYMNPALEQNLVRMMLPDKPNSKNQWYIKY